ncbi:hypothetical protein [Pseudomonas phage vB_PseudoP-SA22]|nr:hypothetical protein [Pseudomonas phage vB_PseudoP-SA22]
MGCIHSHLISPWLSEVFLDEVFEGRIDSLFAASPANLTHDPQHDYSVFFTGMKIKADETSHLAIYGHVGVFLSEDGWLRGYGNHLHLVQLNLQEFRPPGCTPYPLTSTWGIPIGHPTTESHRLFSGLDVDIPLLEIIPIATEHVVGEGIPGVAIGYQPVEGHCEVGLPEAMLLSKLQMNLLFTT